MLKLLGGIIIITACSMIGFYESNQLLLRKDTRKKLYKALMLLKGEIRYSHEVMSQAFFCVSEKCDEIFREFFQNCSQELEKYDGRSLCDIWDSEVEKLETKTVLQKKHLEELKQFGKNLGYLDTEMQIALIDKYMEEIAQELKETDKKMQETCRLYRVLGVMGGILLVIIII